MAGHIDPDGRALAAECEAFLLGRYAELCDARGDLVPVWAWINLLAHGTEEELRAAVHVHPSAGPWRRARALVAHKLLRAVAEAGIPLDRFQRDVLVPLELDVAACPSADRWLPGELVTGLLAALPGECGNVA